LARLIRPNPPLDVKLAVALRDLGGMPAFVEYAVEAARKDRTLGASLTAAKVKLAELHGCEVKDLRLDHTWALENRPKVFKKSAHVDYDPPANDPDWLGYRPHGTQFARSHDVKTRIRGDRGQLSDNALAKKERRRLRKLASNTSGDSRLKRDGHSRPKSKVSRPIRSANRWPPKGSRKIQNRKRR
jgi:hypothetical protein